VQLCHRSFARRHWGMTLLRTIPSTPRLCDSRKQLGSNDFFHAQHVTEPPGSQRNFLVVDSKTETSEIERAFQNFTQERKDIAVLLINQHVSILPIYTVQDKCSAPAWSPTHRLTSTLKTGRRAHPPQRRRIHRTFPSCPRNPKQRSPLRPREGQRSQACAPSVWRVNLFTSVIVLVI
jgi:hypothetical protein